MKINLSPKLQSMLRAAICLSLILVIITPEVAQAQQSWDDVNSVIGETPFYDPNACTATAANSTVSAVNVGSASDNEKTIWNWLVGQGLDGAQAAGIMGNIQQESDFDPTIIQGGGNSNDPAAAGGGGWGLVQWTPGAKVLSDKAGAKATGNIYDIPTELTIAWWEAQGNGLWAGQGNTVAKVAAVQGNSPSAAEQVASIWVNDFEHAGIIGPRGSYADQILALAKQQNWTNANATSASATLTQGNSGSTTTAANAASTCCDTAPSTTASTTGLNTFSSLTGGLAISGTFILGFQASTPKATIEAVFKKYKPAGMYILGTNDAAGAGFNDAFYQALALDAGHPIIAASDEEGLFTRYKYNFTFPSAGTMSNMTNAQVQQIGAQVGAAMVKNGLNTDLAPVLDVGTGNSSDFHQQPGRTFGDDPNTVASKANAFAAGLNSAGINPVYKHFPGLGSSTGNTDLGTVKSPSLQSLENWDLRPYTADANSNNAGVMMDNAEVPGLTGNTPASQSAAAVSLLRNKYAFNGLIMTDDLYAKSVSPSDSGAQLSNALATALKVGVDAPLETYTSDAVLDDAVALAQTYNVNTATALGALDNFAPITNQGANPNNANSQCSSSSTATTGSIVDPFPGGWIPNRLDMGYDGTFKGQIVSPFDGTVQFAGGTNGWNGSLMVVVKASSNVGLPNSQSLYFTEGVKPIVSSGATVKAGTPIADTYPSPYHDAYGTTPDGSGQIEWGVADGGAAQGQQPNTEAVILGINGKCSPTAASKTMDLAFYKWAQTTAHVPGNSTNQSCAGAP
jgi:beta-N-acetylhexosaminidase